MSTPVEQIKERLGIADVIGGYLKLERAGTSYKAKCPFHNEKTPSFFVSPGRNSYYCFGCQAKGDIFTFVQEFEGLDFVGALRVLAQRAGVTLTRVDPKIRSEHARLYLLLEKATRFFEAQLSVNEEVKQYLSGRALTSATQTLWRVGYAPADWRSLFDYLLKEGFKPEEMEKVGLVKHAADNASRFYDAFRGRVMFPILDSASRVIAFSGRILPKLDDGKTGKYINSPETILFSKSNVLYGFHLAKLPIRQHDAAILVEGQMDLLMAHQAGYANTVASSGTALTVQQLERIKRLSENLLIAFDSDSAGLKASERAIHLALSLGMNVKIIPLKDLPAAPDGTAQAGKDPADLIAKDIEAWKAAVTGAKHVIDFMLDEILGSALPDRDKAIKVEKNLLPLLRRLPSKVEQSHFLKLIADRSRLREDALFETMRRGADIAAVSTASGTADVATSGGTNRAAAHANSASERRVFGTLFAAEASGRAATAASMEKQLVEVFGEAEYRKRKDAYNGEKEVLLSEIELTYGTASPPKNEEDELLRNVEEEAISVALSKTMQELTSAERKGNKEETAALLEKCKQLGERLSALKSARFSPTV